MGGKAVSLAEGGRLFLLQERKMLKIKMPESIIIEIFRVICNMSSNLAIVPEEALAF